MWRLRHAETSHTHTPPCMLGFQGHDMTQTKQQALIIFTNYQNCISACICADIHKCDSTGPQVTYRHFRIHINSLALPSTSTMTHEYTFHSLSYPLPAASAALHGFPCESGSFCFVYRLPQCRSPPAIYVEVGGLRDSLVPLWQQRTRKLSLVAPCFLLQHSCTALPPCNIVRSQFSAAQTKL